jgi:hypothetical protein
MNQETIKFCITSSNGEDVSVDIDGGAQDLTNLLATVISDNEEIEMVVTMALLAIHMGRNKAENGNNEEFLSELMMKMKPKAQA